MAKRKRGLVILILWLIFITLVGIIVFFSVQNGEESKEMGKQMILQFAQAKSAKGAASQEEIDGFTYLIRQSARVLAFLAVGIVGTITIHVTCFRWNWFLKTALTLFILTGIACCTEKIKIYIPSRHYSYEEMMLSVAAVAAGFLIASLLTLLGKALKGLSRLMTAGN